MLLLSMIVRTEAISDGRERGADRVASSLSLEREREVVDSREVASDAWSHKSLVSTNKTTLLLLLPRIRIYHVVE